MALFFGRDVKIIGKHVNNALRVELASEPAVAKFAAPKKYVTPEITPCQR